MHATSARHSLIIFKLARQLGNELDDRPCSVVGQSVRMNASPNGLYCYPDLLVVCGEMKFTDEQQDTLVNPTLVIEVLSPSTEAYDRGFKSAQYHLPPRDAGRFSG
jgi:Uma2 family endonuclease